MSIASQINRLLQAKADIKSAIENKGGTVSSSAKLNDYAGLINNLAFPVIQPLSVTSNGTYSASSGYAYNPVTVSVASGGGESSAPTLIISGSGNGGSYGVRVYLNSVIQANGSIEFSEGDTLRIYCFTTTHSGQVSINIDSTPVANGYESISYTYTLPNRNVNVVCS